MQLLFVPDCWVISAFLSGLVGVSSWQLLLLISSEVLIQVLEVTSTMCLLLARVFFPPCSSFAWASGSQQRCAPGTMPAAFSWGLLWGKQQNSSSHYALGLVFFLYSGFFGGLVGLSLIWLGFSLLLFGFLVCFPSSQFAFTLECFGVWMDQMRKLTGTEIYFFVFQFHKLGELHSQGEEKKVFLLLLLCIDEFLLHFALDGNMRW